MQVKYEQVAEQFRNPNLIDAALHDVCLETGQIGSPLAVSTLVVQDDGGDKKLDRVSLSIAQGESVALIDDSGSGAGNAGRRLWPRRLADQRARHRRRAADERTNPGPCRTADHLYFSSDDYLFQGSLGDNLLYGLQHAPTSNPFPPMPRPSVRPKWELTEAKASGNAPLAQGKLAEPRPDPAGARTANARSTRRWPRRWPRLRPEVMAMGVRARIPNTDHQALKDAIVEIRHRLQRDQAAGKVKLPIEHFDITRYNPQASIWENLLFGNCPRTRRAADPAQRLRHRHPGRDGAGAKFFDLGYDGRDHPWNSWARARGRRHAVRAPAFLQAEDIPVLREVVPRTHIGGVDDARPRTSWCFCA